MFLEILGALSTGDTPVSLSWCGEGSFQVALSGSVNCHIKTFKEVLSIGVYIKGRPESVHVALGRFFGANVFMRIANFGPIKELVGKMTELLAFEALDLVKILRIPLAIVGMHFTAGRIVVIILSEDDGSGGSG